MAAEAYFANLENHRIHHEFDLREMKCEKLIREQQKSFDKLMKIRLEKDVLSASIEVQRTHMNELIKSNSNHERFKKKKKKIPIKIFCIF
jgi:hypothetical protein